MGFKFNADNIFKGFAEMGEKTKVGLSLFANSTAKELENYGKSNFKWTPQTGAAHQRLKGDYQISGNKIRCSLSHGVDYGIYLEMLHERRYAIIQPSIENVGPKAIKGLQNLLK